MLKQPAVRAAVLGVALVTTATAFYFIAPVFVREAPLSGYPTLAFMATRTPRPTQTSTETASPTAEPTVEELSSVMLNGEPASLVLTGQFYDIVHVGMGTASVYLVGEDEVALRLEDFEVEDGPDLHVYLAVQDPVPATEGQPLAGAIDLGELQNVAGEQTYKLPEGVDIEDYHSVVIWCVPYNVPFIGASLQIP